MFVSVRGRISACGRRTREHLVSSHRRPPRLRNGGRTPRPSDSLWAPRKLRTVPSRARCRRSPSDAWRELGIPSVFRMRSARLRRRTASRWLGGRRSSANGAASTVWARGRAQPSTSRRAFDSLLARDDTCGARRRPPSGACRFWRWAPRPARTLHGPLARPRPHTIRPPRVLADPPRTTPTRSRRGSSSIAGSSTSPPGRTAGRASARSIRSTGRVRTRVFLAQRYFGEGMTILGDRMFVLTWREHTGFVYSLDFLVQGRFTLRRRGVGSHRTTAPTWS